MIKNIVFILILFNSKNLLSQTFTKGKYDENGLRQGWFEFFPKTKILNEPNSKVYCEYKNDTIHGKYLVYDHKANLRYSFIYQDGKKIGRGAKYNKRGKLQMLMHFNSDTSAYVIHFDSRRRIFKEYYEVKGLRDGLFIYYHKNGKVNSISYYKNGELNGLEKTYSKSGKLSLEVMYIDGYAIGQKVYKKTGEIKFLYGIVNDWD